MASHPVDFATPSSPPDGGSPPDGASGTNTATSKAAGAAAALGNAFAHLAAAAAGAAGAAASRIPTSRPPAPAPTPTPPPAPAASATAPPFVPYPTATGASSVYPTAPEAGAPTAAPTYPTATHASVAAPAAVPAAAADGAAATASKWQAATGGRKQQEDDDEGGWGEGGKVSDWGGEAPEAGSSDGHDDDDEGGWGREADPDADWGDKPGRKAGSSHVPAGGLPHGPPELVIISMEEVEAATEHFSASRLLQQQGTWGPVYQGQWRGAVVAVKALDTLPDAIQDPQQLEQAARSLSRLQHPNLETLLALCPAPRPCLLYHLPAGPPPSTTLQQHLKPRPPFPPPLAWHQRLQVAVEVAQALLFLHSHPDHLIHMGVRPSNISLTPTQSAQLAADPLLAHTTRLAEAAPKRGWGRPKGGRVSGKDAEYLDPQYLKSRQSGPESDVYSLGLVLLQLLTGRPVGGLVEEVADAVQAHTANPRGAPLPLDPRGGAWPAGEALQVARLALECSSSDPKQRPDLQTQLLPALLRLKAQAALVQQGGYPQAPMPYPPPLVPAPLVPPQAAGAPLAQPPLKLDSFELQPPSMFICPITQDIMDDPVVAADGYTYERVAIEGWVQKSPTSPMTNLPLAHAVVVPNHTVKSAIREWVEKHGTPS